MTVKIEAKPNSRKNIIEVVDDFTLKVRIASPPVEGRANKVLIEYLSEIFEISKSKIHLIKGQSSKIKWIKIDLEEDEYRTKIEKIRNHHR
ncbi:hypothetical protein AT05_01220 [Schleiferia thermophila str. Yellowstone]|jgi:uncharacterized protein (TIGR00251 family)|nr:DUF167 domain-containing protein [Schleiferia thermophila]KFD40026.1 hypothetical protein AT05_01220 [Schleiferia thermophila str. Yellowstone]